MTQKERDRLVALKKAKKKLITQKQAAAEIGVGERQVRRMLGRLKECGDKAVIHASRGRPSNRKIGEAKRDKAMRMLSREVYRGFGPTLALYLISMIDDATSRLLARFVTHDSTEENLHLLQSYLDKHGRPLSFYTDKASLFTNLPKSRRGEIAGKDAPPLPPTQIGRALKELDIEWIAAHSPQAKGRIERGFGTAQDRLVKALRGAAAKTLGQANAYLEAEFLPWWNQTLTVVPACSDDAHRPLGKEHNLAAILSHVETRQVGNDYTIRFDNQLYQIQRIDIRAGLRGGTVRVERRLDGTLAVCFRDRYLAVSEYAPRPKALPPKPPRKHARKRVQRKSDWMKNFHIGRNDIAKKTSLR